MFAEQFGSAQQAFEKLFELIITTGGTNKVLRNVSIELVTPKNNEVNTVWRKPEYKVEYLENDFTIHFHPYLDELNMTIFIRSLDLVYGFCNSQYHFSRLLQDVALKLKCQVGNITYMITELHLHKEHYNLKLTYENGNNN